MLSNINETVDENEIVVIYYANYLRELSFLILNTLKTKEGIRFKL